MKPIFASFVILLAMLLVTPSIVAEDGIGRYQAIVIDPVQITFEGGGTHDIFSRVFIIDTKDGHCWTWLPPTGRRLKPIIRYEGQVKPGKEIGQHVNLEK